MMRKSYALLCVSMVLSCLSQAQAQTSSPQTIVCSKVENYGTVTNESLEHPHMIVMNLSDEGVETDLTYIGVAPNWGDEGGGESVKAVYKAATGMLSESTNGIVCPSTLLQAP